MSRRRILSLLLALWALFLCACSGGSAVENISDRAVAYVETAVRHYLSASHSSVIDLFALKSAQKNGEDYTASALVVIETDVTKGDAPHVSSTAKIALNAPSPDGPADFTPYFSYELKDGVRRYLYAGADEPTVVEANNDLVARVGAQNVAEKLVSSFYAVRQNGVVRVDLTFPDAGNTQFPVAALMAQLLLNGDFDGAISPVTISAEIDDATGAFLSYSLTFTYLSAMDPTARLAVTVRERDFRWEDR